ncbi:MAG: glycerol-3-phosphate responsive antiterminator [Angelakisella sp.]|nr:glycerol-3-phosphate responsive antiterminator [Angelakisella sp.]MCI9667028.1 glycerol-3-phosphate responsive antiterminator [Angelakisella sp.]
MQDLGAILAENPIIAAVKDDKGLERALLTDCRIIFLLYGNVCSVSGLVERIKSDHKLVMVHIDLIDGLSSKDVAVAFLRQNTQADGVISTKPAIVKAAKEQGLLAIQRFFLIDSLAMANFQKYTEVQAADAIEILPATMPKVIRKITTACRLPIIAGGLISDKEDILLALQNGAAAVSSTNQEVWTM